MLLLGQTFLPRGNLLALATFQDGADLDRAFRQPPASMEQVLHPEKYWDDARRDPPRPVAPPDQSGRLGDGWALAASGTLGEMGLAVMTGLGGVELGAASAATGSAWTNAAATGWDGDRWQLYVRGTEAVTLLATRWDTEEDAAAFEAAARGAGRRVARRADTVTVAAGVAGDALDALARGALDTIGR